MARCLEVGGCCADGLNAGNREVKVNAALLEQTVSVSSDFWGIFQPYSHLSSCRTSAGLSIPRCFEEFVAGGAVAAGGHGSAVATGKGGGRNSHQALLTTCVGSIGELFELPKNFHRYLTVLQLPNFQKVVSSKWGRLKRQKMIGKKWLGLFKKNDNGDVPKGPLGFN